MMKRFLHVFMVSAAVAAVALAQSNATRPRIVPTPTPAPPVIQGDDPRTERRSGPPIFAGDQTRRPMPTPTPDSADDGTEVIKIETNLITMPVSVLDRDGRFISGLDQRDFRIFENGVEQKVDYFQSVEQPFTVVLLIDVSPSTQFRIDEIHSSAFAFVEQLRPDDRVMVVAFDDRYKVLCRPTNDKRILRDAIYQAQFGNGTSLYEAVDRVISRELSQISGRRAVVLFTDGVDTTSRRASYDGTIADVEEVDVLFYTIRYNTERDGFGSGGWGGNRFPRRGGTGSGNLGGIISIILGGGNFPGPVPGTGGGRGGSSNEYETGRQYLEALAQKSGGRSFEADTSANLNAAFAGIAEELRRQYSLGYYPERVGEVGERKQIRVRVMRPNLVVRAKNSYVVGQSSGKPPGA